MLRVGLVISFVGVLAGCATTPVDQQKQSRWSAYPTVPTGVPLAQDTSAKNSQKYICTMEVEVGSHIPERVCKPVSAASELAEQQKRQETQDRWLEAQRPPHVGN